MEIYATHGLPAGIASSRPHPRTDQTPTCLSGKSLRGNSINRGHCRVAHASLDVSCISHLVRRGALARYILSGSDSSQSDTRRQICRCRIRRRTGSHSVVDLSISPTDWAERDRRSALVWFERTERSLSRGYSRELIFRYWPRRADQRTGRVADRREERYLRLLRHFERVVNLDTQVPDSAFELAVSEQELNGAQILR